MNSIKIKELKESLKIKEAELKRIELEIDNFELDNNDFENSYCSMLNDVYGDFMNMSASVILLECDPIAYRCGLNDFVDSFNIEDNDNYKELIEQKEEMEILIEELETEIEELKTEEK